MVTEVGRLAGLGIRQNCVVAADRHTGTAGCASLTDDGFAVLDPYGVVGTGLETFLAAVAQIDFNPDGHEYLVNN
jgi:hypothetical protein